MIKNLKSEVMKIFKCEKCSGTVSDSDNNCPHCGSQFDASSVVQLQGAQHNLIRSIKELVDLFEKSGQAGATSAAIAGALKSAVPNETYKTLKSKL